MVNHKNKQNTRLVVIGGIIIAVLILAIILVAAKNLGDKPDKSSREQGAKRHQDQICNISFDYPAYWQKSNLKLPLPQEPLSQVTFNEPATQNGKPKNSIFSYICYDAQKYSFEELMEQSPLSKEEIVDVGSVEWKRNGNFVYIAKKDKLLIFQMFFTKNDIKPQKGYEDIYLQIIGSVSFF